MDDLQAQLLTEQFNRLKDSIESRFRRIEKELEHHSTLESEKMNYFKAQLEGIRSVINDHETRIINSLNDTTTKYSNDILDEALRKVLNEYTRAFPNVDSQAIIIETAGRSQDLSDCSNLLNVIQLIHPYNSTLVDPFAYEREDFVITWQNGAPYAYFTGADIPQAGEIIYVKYACKQTVDDLDSAAATTVRDDHEDLLIVGASGQAAMIRASGLNEQWGAKSGDMNQLMIWGSNQYTRFLQFLAEIRTEQAINIFPETYWKLDEWDKR